LANEIEHRPSLPSVYHQSADVNVADGKIKRMPPMIVLPSFGRNASSRPSVSHTAVCYILLYDYNTSTTNTVAAAAGVFI